MPAMAAYKCVNMQFLVGYTMDEFRFIADQFDKGHCDPGAIITRQVPLIELPDAFVQLRGPNNDTKIHVLLA